LINPPTGPLPDPAITRIQLSPRVELWVDHPEYILRLIGQVIAVSVETVKTVKGLTKLGMDKKEA